MPVVAAGLRSLLGGDPGFELTVVSGSLAELRAAAAKLAPQLLLMDLTGEFQPAILNELDASLLARRLVLWVYEIAPESALEAMSLGVRGILRSTLGPDLVRRCLEKVGEGELWFEKALVDDFVDARKAGVTAREVQLIRLIAQGLKNKEIAGTLSITEGTVKVYLSRLFQKVGVKDRFELALYGLRNQGAGLVRPPRPAPSRRGRKLRLPFDPAGKLP